MSIAQRPLRLVKAAARILGLAFAVALLACSALFVVPASAGQRRISATDVSLSSPARTWPMFGNALWDDCTVASVGDLLEAWSIESGVPSGTLSRDDAIDTFRNMGGSANQGVSVLAMLEKWRSTGLYGHALASFAELDAKSVATTKTAISLLGGVLAEVYLTTRTLDELAVGHTVTSTVLGSPSLAHALTVIGYNSEFLTVVTFGHVDHVSWSWWLTNAVLEYGVVPQSFVTAGYGPMRSVPTGSLLVWLSQHNVESTAT